MNADPKFLPRSDWSLVRPSWTHLGTVADAVQHHSGGPGPGEGDLVAFMRGMERAEMERGDGLIALAYQSVIISGGRHDGWTVEVRPWDAQGGATLNHNTTSKAVCIVGDFTNALPTPAAREACAREWARAVNIGAVAPDFDGYGHRDFYATACPGNELYAYLPELWERVHEILNPSPAQSWPTGVTGVNLLLITAKAVRRGTRSKLVTWVQTLLNEHHGKEPALVIGNYYGAVMADRVHRTKVVAGFGDTSGDKVGAAFIWWLLRHRKKAK